MCTGEQRGEIHGQQSDRRRVGLCSTWNIGSPSPCTVASSFNSKQTARLPYVPPSLRYGGPKHLKTSSNSACPLTWRRKSQFREGRTRTTTCTYCQCSMMSYANHCTSSVVTPVKVEGLISKFVVGAGRTSVDRQFFFVNGRPYNPGKVRF